MCKAEPSPHGRLRRDAAGAAEVGLQIAADMTDLRVFFLSVSYCNHKSTYPCLIVAHLSTLVVTPMIRGRPVLYYFLTPGICELRTLCIVGRAACDLCGGCSSAFIEARKACQWSAENAIVGHESHFGSRPLDVREPPRAACRAEFKYYGLAGAGLTSLMGAYRLVSHFGIKTLVLQDSSLFL
ncbi:hypothetical protein BDR22DRAFT_616714 [Usnea florida]